MQELSSILHSQVHAYFRSNFPSRVLGAILKNILQEYKDSSEHCYKNFRPRQAKDVSGHWRRGKIEDGIIAIADRFKKKEFPGLKADEEFYKHHTASYVELTYGNIKMTESCVLSSNELPRDAEFRNTLAETGQLGLFPEPGEIENGQPKKYLYCIILHGVHRDAQKRERCAFACVRFPDRKFKGYIGGSIDLFQMFPAIVEEYYGTAKAEEEAKPVPKRRKKAAGQSGE